MIWLPISFWIVIFCISYVGSIDFINPRSSIDCGISGEDCNLNCTNTTAGCKGATITLYNNANFNLLCDSCHLTIYAYNVANMQLIISQSIMTLFADGNQSDSINIYCGDGFACLDMKIHAIAPNLNLNIYCQYSTACHSILVSGKR